MSYQASIKQNPGRQAWLVEFRHPLKLDKSGQAGRKVRKGLGTAERAEAEELVAQLNEMLANEKFWSLGARAEAEQKFDQRVTDIFYAEIDTRIDNAEALRDAILPLPRHQDGYPHVLFLGAPGAGKTTLLRQLIGSHPKNDKFPSTSVNRTTTYPTEVVIQQGIYFKSVVTFMSEHETRFAVEDCVSAGILRGILGKEEDVANDFLEKSDMRFRLKYILGPYNKNTDNDDPYETDDDNDESSNSSEDNFSESTSPAYVDRIFALSQLYKDEIEKEKGMSIKDMSSEQRNAVLDTIQEKAEGSDDYINIVSEILEELRSKFDNVVDGKYKKSSTGWPLAWEYTEKDRTKFIKQILFFSGNSVGMWGKLLTPLVNGLRASGPFKPIWNNSDNLSELVLIDTEGLYHKADITSSIPENLVARFNKVDCILLVESAKSAMTNLASGKAIESIVNTGHTRKIVIAFTHMDEVKGANLRGIKEKEKYILGGVRNIADNHIAKSVSNDAARSLLSHIEGNTFFLGKLNEAEPTPAYNSLKLLSKTLQKSLPEEFRPVSFPEYSFDTLILSIQEATTAFRTPWKTYLGIEANPSFQKYDWQSLKALTRRYAEGWDDGYWIRPTSDLFSELTASLSKFLETPIKWEGNPTPEQKRQIIDKIKSLVSRELGLLSNNVLRHIPRLDWQSAYGCSGYNGCTRDRHMRIESIYQKNVPIPQIGDKYTQDFIDKIKQIVTDALETVRHQKMQKNAAAA